MPLQIRSNGKDVFGFFFNIIVLSVLQKREGKNGKIKITMKLVIPDLFLIALNEIASVF